MRNTTLRLYKNLLRYGEELKFTDKKYYRYRIQQAFKQNKTLTDKTEVDFQFQKGLKLLQNRRVV